MPATKVSTPTGSRRAVLAGRTGTGSATSVAAATAMSAATGTLTANTARQPKVSVSTPPSSGPTTKDDDAIELYSPSARPRSPGG